MKRDIQSNDAQPSHSQNIPKISAFISGLLLLKIRSPACIHGVATLISVVNLL